MKTIIGLLIAAAVLGASAQDVVFRKRKAAEASATATATDTFNRANSNPMSTNMSDGVSTWVNGPGALADPQIAGNQVYNGVGSDRGSIVGTPTFTANQYAQIALGSGWPLQIGPCVRMQSTSDSGCYTAYVNNGTTVSIYSRNDAGTLTIIGAAFTVSSITTGDVVRLEVSGTTLTLKINGASQGTRTDSTYTTGQPGFFFTNSSSDGDSFQAGDL